MKAFYTYRGRKYYFVWFEADSRHHRDLIIISDPNTDAEKVYYIPCHDKADTAIKVNKKSLSATGGAYGVMRFIQDSIKNNICTSFINVIIDRFTA